MVNPVVDADDLRLKIVRDRSEVCGDLGYANFVCQWPLSYYTERVKQIGFTNLGDVLDVGCGFGQWSAALASLNSSVTGVEIHEKRLATAGALAKSLGLENARFATSPATAMPFEDASFDAIFCYGVLMFVDRHVALKEFHRLLKPGGKLYVCCNARGWWLKLAADNFRSNPAMRRTALRSFFNGKRGAIPNAIDIADVSKLLSAPDWCDVLAAAEGEIGRLPGGPEPVYKPKYLIYDCVIEFVATKQKSADVQVTNAKPAPATETRIETIVRNTLKATTYSYRAMLAQYPVPRPANDPTYHSNLVAVDMALEASRGTSKTDLLRRIFELVTEGAESAESQVIRCITFAQSRFYHHFAAQPITRDRQSVHDPIAICLLGAARCGNVARFLIDIFLVNGFKARLVGGACHSAAEVWLGDRWVMADASLYPSGIIPRNKAGKLMSLSDAIADLTLMDGPPSYINYESGHIDDFQAAYPEAYEPIVHWLREPILPSVGYFGAAFAGARVPGRVQTWAKTGSASDWEVDPEYGWHSLQETESIQGPVIETIQRPQQVRKLWRDGGQFVWNASAATNGGRTAYRIEISETPRGWSYASIPAGLEFKPVGEMFETADNRLEVPPRFNDKTAYVTVRCHTEHTRHAFALPSDEFLV